MRERDWEPPIIELSRPMAAYLLWLVARDLADWRADRRCRLTREEASAFSEFLAAFLPKDMQSDVPAIPPMLQAS